MYGQITPEQAEGLLKQSLKTVNIGGKEYPVQWEGTTMKISIPYTDVVEMIRKALPPQFQRATNIVVTPTSIDLSLKVL
ncbi:MAG: hypothetical protein GXO43_02185 [Crenarchaeota archaeon]|nr:hypothetical protein [Thermoproteota archaeon]